MPATENLKPKVNHNGWVDEVKDLSGTTKNPSLLKEFSENATVHGLRYATDSQHGAFRRGFWCLAFLGMLAGLLFTVFSQVVEIIKLPTRTDLNMEFVDSLPFPAVTLCNLNRVRYSMIKDIPFVEVVLLALTDKGEHIELNSSEWEFHQLLSDDTFVASLAHTMEDTLEDCKWDNQYYDCQKLFKMQKTDYGFCYTFNGREGLNSTPIRVNKTGSKYGLTVIVNIQQEEYILGPSSDAAGLRVILHDHYETPLVEGRGFEIGPGTATKVSLKLREITYLAPPYKSPLGVPCQNTTDPMFKNFLRLYEHYDHPACIAECRYNYTYNTCGCRNLFDLGNDTVCGPEDLVRCYYEHFEKFMNENMQTNCSCPLPCNKRRYRADVSQSGYPSLPLMGQYNELYNISISEEMFLQNYLKLTVSYDDLEKESIIQSPLYTFESIMSSLGGQFGIFLGASLISVLEIMAFGLDFLLFKVLRIPSKFSRKP